MTAMAGSQPSADNEANTTSTYQNTSELFRSNLFRYECQELLSESFLNLSPPDASSITSSTSPKMIKFSNLVQGYISTVKDTLRSSFSHENGKKKLLPIPTTIPLKSDKFQKLGQDWDIPMPVFDHDNDDAKNNCTIRLDTVGSYNHQCMTTKEANGYVLPMVDLAITIGNPKNTNQKTDFWMAKDYLNNRYLDKRNIFMHYIGTILRHKKNRKHIGTVTFSQLSSSPSKLTVILTPPSPSSSSSSSSSSKKKSSSSKDKYKFCVRLLIGIPPSLFSSTRYFPTRNNLPAFPITDDGKDGDGSMIGGTPTYNSSILGQDGMMQTISSLFSSSNREISSSSSLSEAIILLKVWLAQRGMRNGHDTLNSTGLSLLLLYLLKKKTISVRMSSWEMIVIWFKFVSETDWLGENSFSLTGAEEEEEDGTIRHSKSINDSLFRMNQFTKKRKQHVLVMPENGLSENLTISNATQTQLYKEMLSSESHQNQNLPASLIEAFQVSTDGPIFLDSSLTCNFLAHCSPSAMRELAREAKRTLYVIHHCEENRYGVFGNIFCKPSRFWRKFDGYVKISLDQIDMKHIWTDKHGGDYEGIDKWKLKRNDLGKKECVMRGMVELLNMALGDRVTSVRPLTCGNGEGTEFQLGLQQDQNKDDASPMDADQIPSFSKQLENSDDEPIISTCLPNHIVLGFRINPETSSRVVDRGPPAEDSASSNLFVSLWGKQLAQLRRFKDGAIVHAVVWKDVLLAGDENEYSNVDSSAGIIEKVIQHVLQLHFLKKESNLKLELRNILSLVEGLSPGKSVNPDKHFQDSTMLHKNVMRAFDSLSTLLKEDKSKLGLPLSIDAVEPLSPCLRYSSLFPPVPHPLLGGSKVSGTDSKVSSITPDDPILIQIRFEGSSKWPTDVNAMGAAKCAMLIKLANGIEEGRSAGFSGPAIVHPNHLDIGYKGYSWRIVVRADQELRMLDSLRKPSAEAVRLHEALTKKHVISSLHHSVIHAIHTRHPSASAAVRLAQRWVSAHMLSGNISTEALELIVAQGYVNPYPLEAPATGVAGFLRFLNTLGKFDWLREPFIVDPQGHLSSKDISQIRAEFEIVRGGEYKNGPPMFIISPFDRYKNHNSDTNIGESDHKWVSTSTEQAPERVILSRMCSLAQLSYRNLMLSCMQESKDKDWSVVFQESPSSLKSYSVLLRVSPDIVVDKSCCSSGGQFGILKSKEGELESSFTRSLKRRFLGPKQLRMRLYKNLNSNNKENIQHGWRPVQELVSHLRSKFGSMAVFFYNEHSPNVIALLWRPTTFQPQTFSVAHAEYQRPVERNFAEDSLVVTNSDDVLREVEHIGRDIVVNMKILDDRSLRKVSNESNDKKRKAPSSGNDDSDSDSGESDEE